MRECEVGGDGETGRRMGGGVLGAGLIASE